jgi:hypothetical protein
MQHHEFLSPAACIAEGLIDELLGRGNLNPSRVGCLPRETLSALARGQRPMGDRGYEHIAACSPRYCEFRAIQHTWTLRRH